MRILILTNNDIGLYKFRKELISDLINRSNEVYISLPDGEMINDLIGLGCKFIFTPIDRRGINPITDSKLIYKYYRTIKEVKPDKVITYTIKPNIYGGIVCRLLKVQLYANVTGLGTAFQGNRTLAKIVTVMYKFAFKRAKKVFFENKGNMEAMVGRKIIGEDKVHCLHGAGVNIDEFPYTEYPEDEKICFLFIGRIMREKGIDEFFEATKRLKADGEEVQFDVIGYFDDDYEKIVEKMDKSNIICYYGYQSDVRPFIAKSHCFVLPSYHEGMANTLLECGAMGRPLITSNIHGCLEAVQDGRTGYLCKVKDANDLYRKMKKFISLTYEEKKEMGRRSHEFIVSMFDKRKVVDETVRVIMDEC